MLSTVVTMERSADARSEFTDFVTLVEPRLRRAFSVLRGRVDGGDALAEALAWAWEHWAEVQTMENPAGYLYRVGSSRTRGRRRQRLDRPVPRDAPGFEPGLEPALQRLSTRQRSVVVLVHGCDWTHQEVADALGISRSSVGTHLDRAMSHLRSELGVEHDG